MELGWGWTATLWELLWGRCREPQRIMKVDGK